MSLKDKVAVVGVGVTYAAPGSTDGLSASDLGILATEAALDDAGLTREDLRGFAWSSGAGDPGGLAAQMGVPEVSFAANLTSGAGGGAGALGLAAAAVAGGFANVCLSLIAVQTAPRTPGRTSSGTRPRAVAGPGAYGGPTGPDPDEAFSTAAAITTQAQAFAVIANRYMHQYGVKREHLAQVLMVQRDNAAQRPDAASRSPLTLETYLEAPMIADPLSTLDCTPELEGSFAVAVITTTAERARDLRQPAVIIAGATTGGIPSQALPYQAPADSFASSGHGPMASELYQMAEVTASDIDVALLYDDYSPMVLMQLEDYGFCAPGEAGPFVVSDAIAYGSTIPVNTHGGNLSDAYLRGATHVVEAVEQLRGRAVRQVEGCELALVTGSPGLLPLSAAILRRA